jgi:hypothetical protein
MICIDYSQILIANCLSQGEFFEKGKPIDKMESVARHMILTTILSYKTQFSKKYGDIVICVDGGDNWRKGIFPQYKAVRKSNREDSNTDWKSIFAVGRVVLNEIREVFPFKVVREDTAEGDDVIAVLCKYIQDNELIVEGLEETPQKFLAISSDGDFKQLFKYRNYAQYNPIMRKAVARPEPSFLLEKIIRGDSGDGVPSVLCANDFFINKDSYGRATPITKKVIDKFTTKTGLTEIELTRFERNQKLIDFDYIPQEVSDKIIHTYLNTPVVKNKNGIFEFFIKNRMSKSIDIQNFF